jgi:hypothetical protein
MHDRTKKYEKSSVFFWTSFDAMRHGDAMTDSFDFQRQALSALECAQAGRTALAEAHRARPVDHAAIGVLKAGVTYSLKTAQIYAELGQLAAIREAAMVAAHGVDR